MATEEKKSAEELELESVLGPLLSDDGGGFISPTNQDAIWDYLNSRRPAPAPVPVPAPAPVPASASASIPPSTAPQIHYSNCICEPCKKNRGNATGKDALYNQYHITAPIYPP
ncbi:hypothetical protein [Pseudomonas sp. McL0111]|uniref:hypothetical protein n=1 Tax=Pseudomonas sp. McL0111 TaxID=3457357 RepID=UPI00403E750F